MKSLVGLLLVISGTILAVPVIYEALSYIRYEGYPIVPIILGAACIVVGLFFLITKGRGKPKAGIWQE